MDSAGACRELKLRAGLTSAGGGPAFAALGPHSADVGMRDSGTIVARTPTTKPAESSSSAQPLSTARKPAYAKSDAIL